MSQLTVKKFSETIKVPLDRLLKQMGEAGLKDKDESSTISNEEKRQLLDFLRTRHQDKQTGSAAKKVVLRRKSTMELQQKSATSGRVRASSSRSAAASTAKKVNVEVRKRRTYAKRSDLESAEENTVEEETSNTAVDSADVSSSSAENEAEKQNVTPAVEETAPEVVAEAVEEKVVAPAEQPSKKPATTAAEKPAIKNKKEKLSKQDILASKDEVKSAAEERRKRIQSRIVSRPSKPTSSSSSKKHEFQKPTKTVTHEVILPEAIAVSELARRMTIKATEIIKVLMGMGSMVTINQVLDRDTAALVVEELGHTYKFEDDAAETLLDEGETYEAVTRPPVVTIMGHVDHGKTSLLDYIRKSNVTAKESGGITQHIGAYHVELDKGIISFLDTPGHAAFTAMRARGANVTDIVIIVVAADDGVMPQTVEAIQHAKAAKVPVIVAINKMDKDDANPDRVKQELGTHEIIPEDWGGDTMFVEVSAKTGLGVDDLLEGIILQAEILELKAPVEGKAKGTVVESRMDKGLGSVVTILVQSGTLRQGDIILVGEYFGRVRALRDENGDRVKEVGPSIPVEVLGISGLPDSGDDAAVVDNERTAREIALLRQNKAREVELSKRKGAKLEEIFNQAVSEGEMGRVNLIIKADTQGSVEALSDSLVKLSNEEVKVSVVASGVGGINESDVTLAEASQAMLIGFNVRADSNARKVARQAEIEPRYYSIIYDVVDDIKKAISSKLKPEIKEEITGIAEVRDVFRSSKLGAIAGCLVMEGTIKRGNPIRVLRDNVVIFEGELESLRRFKDEVNEVKAGVECGIGVKNYNDIKPKDQIEVFIRVEKKRTL